MGKTQLKRMECDNRHCEVMTVLPANTPAKGWASAHLVFQGEERAETKEVIFCPGCKTKLTQTMGLDEAPAPVKRISVEAQGPYR